MYISIYYILRNYQLLPHFSITPNSGRKHHSVAKHLGEIGEQH